MIECENCGSAVTEQYVRVFTPTDYDQPRACPSCPNLKREPDGTVREKR